MVECDPPFSHSLFAGGMAGLTVDVLLFPLDTVKTRLQSAEGFVKSGGFRGVYAGVGAAAAGSIPTAALFFCTYDSLKCVFTSWLQPSYFHFGYALSASSAETMACLSRVPIEIVKQRQQACPQLQAGTILRATLAREGFPGLYRGFFSTVMREVPFSIIQLPLWEELKRLWSRYRSAPVTPWQAGVCGGVAGAAAAAVTTPFDVAKTRIMLAEPGSNLANGSFMYALRVVYTEGGMPGLFAGLVPRVLWITLGGTVFFGSYSVYLDAIS